jgi:hypothetical protein
MMDYMTKANSNLKHTHTAKDETQLSENTSPLEKEKFWVNLALMSLPATIKSLAQGFHMEFLALQNELL